MAEHDLVGVQIESHNARPAGRHLVQHARRRADLAWGAVAALKGVVLDECLLQRVELVAAGKALGGDVLSALVRDGQDEPTDRAPAVHQNRAGAALAVITTLLGAAYTETLAQGAQQGRPGVDD